MIRNIQKICFFDICSSCLADGNHFSAFHQNIILRKFFYIIQINQKRFVNLQKIGSCGNFLYLLVKGLSDKYTFYPFAVSKTLRP